MSDMKKFIKLMENAEVTDFDSIDGDTLLGFFNSMGDIEFLMKKEDVEDIAQPGANDEAVERVTKEPYIRYQLDQLDFDVIKNHIHEAMPDFEAEDSENATKEEYEQRLIWDIAWTIRDDEQFETEDDYDDDFVKKIRSKM
ncbi:hypothetical protein PBI_SCTP2_508 [Salicola phage SCTP-2]|nr:hypothetical protein PBI_SCTP2_508 [Salicola phage SCTP-2]